MIKELTLGSWVRYKNLYTGTDKYWEVEGINQRSRTIDIEGNPILIDNLEPIPIRFGWLLRLGFKETRLNLKFFETHGIRSELTSKAYVYTISPNQHLVYCKTFKFFFTWGDASYRLNQFKNVEYVHQVQLVLKAFGETANLKLDFRNEQYDNVTRSIYGRKLNN